MNKKPIVAVIDDEKDIGELAAESLSEGYEVKTYTSPQVFLTAMLAKEFVPAVIVTDLKMPGMTGLEMLYQLSIHEIMIPAILFSGFLDKDAMAQAIGVGVIHTLDKPLDFSVLVETVDRAMIDYELIKNHVEMVSTVRLLREVYVSFRQNMHKTLPPAMVTRLLSQPFTKKGGMQDWGYEKMMTVLESRISDLILDEALLTKQKADKIKYDSKLKS